MPLRDDSDTVTVVADNYNIAEMASRLAETMSGDSDEVVEPLDVLDWLAASGLTLRPDDGDATVAYQLALDELGDPSDE